MEPPKERAADGGIADWKDQGEWTPEGELNRPRVPVGETESKLRKQKCVCWYAQSGRNKRQAGWHRRICYLVLSQQIAGTGFYIFCRKSNSCLII